MKLHDIAFYFALFFIIGVALASLAGDFSYKWLAIILSTLIVGTIFWIFDKKFIAGLSITLFLSGAYYFIDDARQIPTNLIFNQKVLVRGAITKVAYGANGVQIQVGNVRAYLKTYPSYAYGDLVEMTGKILPLQEKLKNYLLKDGVTGTMSFPNVNLIAKNQGNFLMSGLNKLKMAVIDNLNKVLPAEKAQFMTGLLLGGKSGFSQDFKDQLSASGTSHLVALSGYNIMVVASGIAFLLASFLASRLIFVFTIIILALFVAMTGAESSVVRAALMGTVLLLGNEVERLYSLRNALTIVAAFMVFQNPKILIFDLGFQLSFAALLGIVYLGPIVSRVLHLKDEPGFLNWRKNLVTTISAQIAVLPLIATSFGSISFVGIFSNIVILGLIPITMFIGFIAALTGFISYYVSLAFGLGANIFLSYIIFVIKIFSSFGSISDLQLGYGFLISYYIILIGGVWYYHRNGFPPSLE